MTQQNNRMRIGDVIEIPLSPNYGYAQYAFNQPTVGELFRVLQGIHNRRPENIQEIVNEREVFWTFISLGAFHKDGSCSIVGNFSIPEACRELPRLRTGFRNPRTGKVAKWQIWTNCKAGPLVEELTPELAQLSLFRVRTIASLRKAISAEWRPELET